MLLQDFQSEAICCTPSYALAIAEYIRKTGVDLQSMNLKYAILGAEPWTESIRAEVEAKLGVTATNIYGLSEIIGPGVSQEDFEEQGSGSYVWEDHFYPEIVDKDTGEPVPEGTNGVLVFTTLTKEAMPMIRYWTNDITSIYYDKSAKRTHVKMGQILGRSDDMLIIRGVNLFHTQVEAVLEHFPEFSPNYQLVVSREGAMDEVAVNVEIDNDLFSAIKKETTAADADIPRHDNIQAACHRLSKRIKNDIGLSMKINVFSPGTIHRSEGGKLNRIVDLRK